MQSKTQFNAKATYELKIITTIVDIKTRSGIKFINFVGEDCGTGKKHKCKSFDKVAEELLSKSMGEIVVVEGYIKWDDYDKTDCLFVQGLVDGSTGLRTGARRAFAELGEEERRAKFEELKLQKEKEGYVPVGIKENGVRKLHWRLKEDAIFIEGKNRWEDKTEFLMDEHLSSVLMEKTRGAAISQVKKIRDDLLAEYLGGLWDRVTGHVKTLQT